MIEIFWSEQKKLIDAGYDFSYITDISENYIIFTIDGPIIYKARVAITTPRNTDQIDFEDNYETSAVTNIEPRANEVYYTKSEVDALLVKQTPHVVKFSVVAGSAQVTDEDSILSATPTKNSTGNWAFSFKAAHQPRMIGQIGQSNIVIHYDYPFPSSGAIDIIFKLLSTGGNFDPNEVLLCFWDA